MSTDAVGANIELLTARYSPRHVMKHDLRRMMFNSHTWLDIPNSIQFIIQINPDVM